MASRMDRYYKENLTTEGRSTRNKSLYEQIEDLDTYSNIESVATIENTNEIDISKVRDMIKSRESYKKQRQLSSLIQEKEETKIELEEPEEEKKNYDIKQILAEARKKENIGDKRKLDEEQYNLLKSLNKKNSSYDIEKEELELKELINTITSNKDLNDLSVTDDVGLLDELKSNTMVGDAASIKKILDEEKNTKVNDTMEIDKSFYTSSLEFTKRDFEELKDINHRIKNSNKFIIILLSVIILIGIGVALFFILK